ncbi:DgyrCDS8000 [Dimorphilus gyrociliatus]|uniref:Phosphate transporter n=1 Tax=Dimorphilus gyrociliatus TaxID=2664684 RepID=A0A7I8VXU0_9ANNE|nr:DgyrCDS8000 [Dimorphilus gyrociliatus]
MVSIDSDQLWMVITGFIIAFALAFGIGANDVANSFGTSVGSGVLTLRKACILASVFETLGAVLLGAKVSDTIRKGIIDVTPYQNDTSLFMVGNVAALSAATLLRMPVSATHSIVGATIGFALVAHGSKGINWHKLGLIIGSWFISPIASGIVSTSLFYFCKYFILRKKDPLEPGLLFLPMFYGITIIINLFSVFYHGPKILRFDKIPLWGVFIISFGSGLITAVLVRLVIVPWQRKKILRHCKDFKGENNDNLVQVEFGNTAESSSNGCSHKNFTQASAIELKEKCVNLSPPDVKKAIESKENVSDLKEIIDNSETSLTNEKELVDKSNEIQINGEAKSIPKPPLALEIPTENQRSVVKDRPETARLFSFLQILTAIFGSFAHGGNDVSNAIGPLVSLWLVGTQGKVFEKAPTPIWILFYGGFGISIGLWVWGRRVIKTLGQDLTKITPSSGFCIEIGSALTVLVASNIGIPISTTHCKVGSVVCVGRFRSRQNVDWSIFRNIVFAWLVTLPIAGGISAAMMAALKLTLKTDF